MEWLPNAPRCRDEDDSVCVTIDLEPGKAPAHCCCLCCRSEGLEALARQRCDLSMTCRLPRIVFTNEALVQVAVVPACSSDQVVLAWTQISALEEASYRGRLVDGAPVLERLRDA